MRRSTIDSLARRLLPGMPGFVLKSPLVFICPLGHVLRGIYFDRGNDSRDFYVEAFILPLFVPRSHISFEFGHRLRQPNGQTCWNADSKELPESLFHAIKNEALPFFARTGNPLDVADMAASLLNPLNPHYCEALALSLARAGKLVEANAALDALLNQIDPSVPWQIEIAERARSFKRKLLADPLQAQQQLDEWELESMLNLGLEKFRASSSITLPMP